MEEENSDVDENENENSFNPNFSFSVAEVPSTPSREDRQKPFATAIAMAEGSKGSKLRGAKTSRADKAYRFD
jgi:hypothetical protein